MGDNRGNLMAKFYVTVLDMDYVIDAKTPIEACIKVIDKSSSISVGLKWKVSERGFKNHPSDIYIDDYDILKEMKKRDKE
jgi:hypothetical protein